MYPSFLSSERIDFTHDSINRQSNGSLRHASTGSPQVRPIHPFSIELPLFVEGRTQFHAFTLMINSKIEFPKKSKRAHN